MASTATLRPIPGALLAAGMYLPQLSLAATFVVDTTVDVGDPTPDGQCLEVIGGSPPSFGFGCPLRAAIDEANALPGLDTILIQTGVYPLTVVGPNDDDNNEGDLDILEEVVIEGQGGRSTAAASSTASSTRCRHRRTRPSHCATSPSPAVTSPPAAAVSTTGATS